MKTIATIGTIFGDDVGSELFGRMIAIYPEGENGPATFRLSLPVEDRRTKDILRELQRAGCSNWPGSKAKYDGKTCFRFDLHREYEEADYRAADYLWLYPESHIVGGYVPEVDAFVFRPNDLDNTCDFAFDDDQGVLIPGRVRQLLEKSGLRGVEFRPTVLADDSAYSTARVASGGKYGEPWWELASGITLPPYAPSMTVKDPQGGSVLRGTEGYVEVWEPPFCGVELHYLRSEIASKGFDIAQSREWTGPSPLMRNLIVSKKFYEFCESNRLACEYIPVRLDPG